MRTILWTNSFTLLLTGLVPYHEGQIFKSLFKDFAKLISILNFNYNLSQKNIDGYDGVTNKG